MNLTYSTRSPERLHYQSSVLLSTTDGEVSITESGRPDLVIVVNEWIVITGRGLDWLFASNEPPRRQWSFYIYDLARSDLHLAEPVPVAMYGGQDQFVAYVYDLDEMGIGDSESAALDDLRQAIAEAYQLLKEEPQLGPIQQRHLSYLRRIIREQ